MGHGVISPGPSAQEGGGGLVGAEGGKRGKRKERCTVGADRLLEHGNSGISRVVEVGRQPRRNTRPRWVSDDGG